MNQAAFLSLPNPAPALQACVVMPARDEAQGIKDALNCFANQRDIDGEPLDTTRFEILLLANNCQDRTAEIARRWGKHHPAIALYVIEVNFSQEQACVGHARRLLMDAASSRLGDTKLLQYKPRAICSTDADTQVSPYWIAHTLEEMNAGAKAVGGRIFLKREVNDLSRRTYLLDTAYRLLSARLESKLNPNAGDPYPRHFQFFGASLAIRPEIYDQIGGLPHVRCLEDMALKRELTKRDIEIRHSPHVAVWTSARRDGRVETGLSTQLSEWNELGKDKNDWIVPSGHEIAFKARLQRRLRSFWLMPDHNEELDELATVLMMNPRELESLVKAATFFGELWELVWNKPASRAQFASVSVECALGQLRQMLEGIREK